MLEKLQQFLFSKYQSSGWGTVRRAFWNWMHTLSIDPYSFFAQLPTLPHYIRQWVNRW